MRNCLGRRPVWLRFIFNPSQRFVGAFVLFILVPGAFLGVFALRVLRQEGQLFKQRTRERMEIAAKEIGRDLDSEFSRWEESVRLTVKEGTLDSDSLPEIIHEALGEPGGGVILSKSEVGYEAFPSHSLLYVPQNAPAPRTQSSQIPASLVKAESLEIEQKDYRGAILSYQRLLNSTDAELRPLLQQRLGRTLRKADRLDEADRAYQELLRLDTSWLGGLPSDLIAQAELCSLAAERKDRAQLADRAFYFFQNLTGGKWPLDKPRYLYYSDSCHSWFRESQAEINEFGKLQRIEKLKLSLTRAAEELLNEPKRILAVGDETHLAFWHSTPFTAVILSENFLKLHWWPKIISIQGEDVQASLHSTDGHVIFGSPPTETPPSAVMQDVRIGERPWLVQVWPGNPDAIQKDMKQRQTLFLAILVFVAALLIFGSYITVRIVRRELEIARLRADFVSTVSHEFRSPLTGIRHLGEMLLDDRAIDTTKQRQYSKLIVQESDRLTRLVENILDFSRMEDRKKEYWFEPLSPTPWLQSLAEDFEKEISADGVVVKTKIPDCLPKISADREALGNAVHNLLDNAVKYSTHEKVVWLDAEVCGREVKISVRDKGVGISELDRKHIFERFYRADSEISKRIKGAGLGLSLVRHIVTAHGGKVECESEAREGSTFSIRLPVVKKKEGDSDE
jgi:signal transduction histidine kinase